MPVPFSRTTAPVSLARFRAIAAGPRPVAVTPGHADLQRARGLADAGRRLEAIVALEGRRTLERRRRRDR